MGRGIEYILVLIIVTVAAYCTVTPLANKTGESLNNSAEMIAGRNR